METCAKCGKSIPDDQVVAKPEGAICRACARRGWSRPERAVAAVSVFMLAVGGMNVLASNPRAVSGPDVTAWDVRRAADTAAMKSAGIIIASIGGAALVGLGVYRKV